MARSTALILMLVLGVVSCSESPREVQQYSIQEFLATTSYTGASFSPDQSMLLVSSNQSGIYNAYALPTTGSPPVVGSA